ncbi:hypothetical protein [Borrelia sp. P9F1]|uniref:hypothetical protein n=1 Tax=Borrelia sp. P9F1 TaxID=3058374 RepID=UPI00264981D2|nr:hypothetical protein [Borrelia sp. P9F1]WKC58658.1 hypothetical protein QYZ68_05500 [Borrelia sp. P9F1]
MGKIFLLILFIFCLLACRHDNKKNSSNNRKKETISVKTKIKKKKKKKLENISTKQDDIETRKQEEEENEEEEYDEGEDEEDGDEETNIAIVTGEKQEDNGAKGQLTTPKNPIPRKVETIKTEYTNGQTKTYYFKEHAIIDIKPTISHIKTSLVFLPSTSTASNIYKNEYSIMKDAKFTHIRILADKQGLENMQIKDLGGLVNSSRLDTLLNNESNILKIMLFSKGSDNVNENIILPLNRRFIHNLEKALNPSSLLISSTASHTIDVIIGNDNVYTKLDFSKFSNEDVGGSKLILIQTEQNAYTVKHKLRLDPSIYTLLKDITIIERLKKFFKMIKT